MDTLVSILENLHQSVGNTVFLLLMAAAALVLSIKLIPVTTDMMVNAAAGLAGKYLGRQYRTLVINCSTNNPEIATMLIAFLFAGAARAGGIGTPLGSNFANIYLIFAVALGWVFLTGLKDRSRNKSLLSLLRKEKKVVVWHLIMSVAMFLLASLAFRMLYGQFPIGAENTKLEQPTTQQIVIAACLCLFGVGLFIWRDAAFRKQRPELFEDIDDEEHVEDWKLALIGTLGLVVSCYLINAMFVVASNLYSESLSAVFGPAVFAALHYFAGALVTSLPEMNVAISNYRRIESPDLNTAMASASASNMSNLAIAAVGCLIALFLN